ncbi:transcriptional regulator [Pseudomonas sp. Z4-20]|uniref:transcriptional regulator n=1 Tax=Pseudomonas sp. Z4-20 TaxID=2817414 RepID=UPI003DA7D29F
MFMNKTPLDRAIAEAGSGAALAKVAGVTPMAVSYWKIRGVPARHVLTIEVATGVSRHELRPDIYPRQTPKLDTNLLPTPISDQSVVTAVDSSSGKPGL